MLVLESSASSKLTDVVQRKGIFIIKHIWYWYLKPDAKFLAPLSLVEKSCVYAVNQQIKLIMAAGLKPDL